MREILFRGQRVDTKEWVYGWYFESFTGIAYIIVMHDHLLGVTEMYEVVKETVGQFIGLLDRNVVKIFDGDILGFRNRHTIYGIVKYEHSGFGCVWDKKTAKVKAEEYKDFIPTNLSMWEVIDNIHDSKLVKEDL